MFVGSADADVVESAVVADGDGAVLSMRSWRTLKWMSALLCSGVALGRRW